MSSTDDANSGDDEKSPAPAAPKSKARLGFFGRGVTAIATLGPLGMRMPAPGTWGSGAGVLLYVLLFQRYNTLGSWATYLGLLTASVALAILVCHIAEKHLGKTDPGEVILDEVVAMPIVFIGAAGFLSGDGNYGWLWFLIGFGLFRLFDIWKPFGIRRLQKLPGGIGVVVDDLAAAAASCAALHLLHLLSGFFR